MNQLPKLHVSENQRYLITENGKPFFYLGDTAWELFHRLDREEINHYLEDRAKKGFNVIQCVLLGEIDGLTVPNREGELPLIDLNPAKPNEKYFDLVDYVVDRALELGLYLAILPTWGSHLEDQVHSLFENVHPITDKNARAYAAFLGKRYTGRNNIIWVLGGDRASDGYEAIWEAMADALGETDAEALKTYHSHGEKSSSDHWHHASWLDFNMLQSGHNRFSNRNWEMIAHDYALDPAKPVLDGEPCYEGIPAAFNGVNPRLTDYDTRKAAYWSVFSGAMGHTYGHNCIWQMYRPDEYKPILWAHKSWREAMQDPGSSQLIHLRNLMLSRPYLDRIPGTGLVDIAGQDSDHIAVTRDGTLGKNDASYIMAYLPLYRHPVLSTSVIAGKRLRVWFYDPRTGEAILKGELDNPGSYHHKWEWRILPEQGGPDWILILEDASKNYPAPGTSVQIP